MLSLFRKLLFPWEIYVQPPLNGLRPDFVALHPENGIAIFEVKDWDLRKRNYRYDGLPDPIDQLLGYKDEVFKSYCPSLYENKSFGLVTVVLVFPFASRTELQQVFDQDTLISKDFLSSSYPKQYVLAGREDLQDTSRKSWFPIVELPRKHMSKQIADELRPFLSPSAFDAEKMRPLELSQEQRKLVHEPTPDGSRRIMGAAGSGKSSVLAARAARLAKEGKKVLVVYFNITLRNNLKTLAARCDVGRDIENITWLHYHGWVRRICFQMGQRRAYLDHFAEAEGDEFPEGLPDLVDEILKEENKALETYDAVLVDEAQDFETGWLVNLRKVLRTGGEMLVFADKLQDIHGKSKAWTAPAMHGAGFHGPWKRLKRSYRLPSEMVPHIEQLAEMFLPTAGDQVLPEPVQFEIPFGGLSLRWIQVGSDQVAKVAIDELYRLPVSAKPPHPLPWADIVFLSGHDVGSKVVTHLERDGFRVRHTFYEERTAEEHRRKRQAKFAFYTDHTCLKATTIHSFKGWESRALVMHLSLKHGRDSLEPDPDSAALVYAALTRVMRHEDGSYLTVVCDTPNLASYGKSWPEFIDLQANESMADNTVPEEVFDDDGEDLSSYFNSYRKLIGDFDPCWRSLIANLIHAEAGIDPGEVVERDGRSVGAYLAMMSYESEFDCHEVHLVDDMDANANEVAVALKESGCHVWRVRPDTVFDDLETFLGSRFGEP